MSVLALLLGLVRVLPVSPAILLARTTLLVYLLLRPDYRSEIRRNQRLLLGRAEQGFWLRNAWRVGCNMALMAGLGRGRGDAIIDSAELCGDNIAGRIVEQDLHRVMVSFHHGLWEFLPDVLTRQGFAVDIVVGPQRDSGLDRLLGRVRRRARVRPVESLRDLASGLDAQITGFMLDNTSRGRREAVTVDGCRFLMPALAFDVAGRSRADVIPFFGTIERGRLRVRVYPSGGPAGAASALLAEVRRRPEDWVFWAKADGIRAAA